MEPEVVRTVDTEQVMVAVTQLADIIVGARYRKDYGDISSLVSSIQEHGVIQPLAVRAEGDKYRLIAGGRRYKAAEEAGVDSVPIRIYPESLSDLELRSLELVENMERKDLTMEEELALKLEIHTLQVAIYGEKKSTSKNAKGWSMRDTAKMLGSSVGALSEDLKLARAMEEKPELKQAKNKNEASKLLRRYEEELILAELSERAKQKELSSGLTSIKANLMKAYQVGDCLIGCSGLPAGTIELAEVDPPYGVGLDIITKDSNYREVTKKKYAELLQALLPILYAKMAEHSWLLVWFPMERYTLTAELITSAGFTSNWIPLIWSKTGSNERVQRPEVSLANGYENCFYAMKGKPRLVEMGKSNVFPVKTIPDTLRRHPAERPIRLMEQILSIFGTAGTRVAVPFAGSGNTILACTNLGMPSMGWDTTQVYKDSFDAFVDQATLPFKNKED